MPNTLFSVADTVHFHLPRLMGGKKVCNQLQQISIYHSDPLEEAF